jgi:TolB-like protein
MRAAALLSALLCSGSAWASSPTVAVMPFKDLSGGRGAVGEAIRETVTTDLKDVRGLSVIERGAIDKVLAEQSLQAQRADLDPLSTVKVGKLLGASLIVTGAYQRAAATVRLTARFVKVETGEIIGTAKVDGAEATFLALQDRVTAELLRSAGMDAGQVKKVAQRNRPKLRSLRGVELYGDAVVENDDQKRGEILRQALDAEPGFVYAAKDLEALERRMRAYAVQADAAQDKAQRELHAAIEAEKDPLKRGQMQMQQLGGLVSARRYRAVVTEARAILGGPPSPPAPGNVRVDEIAGFYLITALGGLKDQDGVLREGEAFMKRFPGSVYFKGVETTLRMAIDQKRKQVDGKERARTEAAALQGEQRWDLCQMGWIYERQLQHKEAQRLFRACVTVGSRDRLSAIRALVGADIECADWPAARRDLKLLDDDKSEHVGATRESLQLQIPADG